MRELQAVQYSNQQFADENLLLNFKALDPITLSKNLTWLWGKDTDEFPLTFFTEGNGAVKSIKSVGLNDTQYKWKIMGHRKTTFRCLGLASALTNPGKNRTRFEVDFDEDFAKYQWTIVSPDNKWQLRVQEVPRKIAANRYRYSVEMLNGNLTDFVTTNQFTEGLYWSIAAASVAASKSDGTGTTHMAPGEMTNQFGFYRHSFELAGNVTNKVTNIEFDLPGGGKTNKWIPFDYKMFELGRKRELEEEFWYSEYNRDANGVILSKDPDTGEPIPKGAGIKQILTSTGQYDTYSSLTLNKLKAILNASVSNRVDSTPTEIIMYGGRGAQQEFHNAIASDASLNSYFTPLGEQNIKSGKDGHLMYGSYFNQYKTIDGYTLTFQTAKMFDWGSRAKKQRDNGEMINGHPRDSYNLVILDHSMTNDGERNIMKVYEEGREIVSGVYKGLSPVPDMWGSINSLQLGTRKDISAYEVMVSQGINIANYTTSFWLERV